MSQTNNNLFIFKLINNSFDSKNVLDLFIKKKKNNAHLYTVIESS